MKRPRLVAGIGARVAVLITLASAMLFIPFSASHPDMLPTHGTFKGVYHKNRAGVGTFGYFFVSKEVTAQLDKYDGKYIELEVTRIEQPINPGPGFIDVIGKITELPPAPIEIRLEPRLHVPESAVAPAEKDVDALVEQLDSDDYNEREAAQKKLVEMGIMVLPLLEKHRGNSSIEVRSRIQNVRSVFALQKRTFDVVAYVKNTGDKPLVIGGQQIGLWINKYRSVGQPDAVYTWGGGYTRRQMAFGSDRDLSWPTPELTYGVGHRSNMQYEGAVTIAPNEIVPFIWPDETMKGEESEIVAHMEYRKDKDESIPVYGFFRLDENVDAAKMIAAGKSPLKVESTVDKQEDGWTYVTATASNPGKDKRYLMAREIKAGVIEPGLVQALTKEGSNEPVSCSSGSDAERSGRWRSREIDGNGVKLTLKVRHSSLFPEPITQIAMWTFGDKGAERIILVDKVNDRTAEPLPQWGKEEKGRRCRIRMANSKYKKNEEITFFLQTASSSSSITNFVTDSSQVFIQGWIDGKLITEKDIGGELGLDMSNYFPFEKRLYLGKKFNLAPGKHTLKVMLRCEGESDGPNFERINITSNEVEFNIED